MSSASLENNGKVIASASGANVLGNPLTALTWLANQLNQDGYSLLEGEVIMTGAAAAAKVVEPGSLVARFGDLGAVGGVSMITLRIEE